MTIEVVDSLEVVQVNDDEESTSKLLIGTLIGHILEGGLCQKACQVIGVSLMLNEKSLIQFSDADDRHSDVDEQGKYIEADDIDGVCDGDVAGFCNEGAEDENDGCCGNHDDGSVWSVNDQHWKCNQKYAEDGSEHQWIQEGSHVDGIAIDDDRTQVPGVGNDLWVFLEQLFDDDMGQNQNDEKRDVDGNVFRCLCKDQGNGDEEEEQTVTGNQNDSDDVVVRTEYVRIDVLKTLFRNASGLED